MASSTGPVDGLSVYNIQVVEGDCSRTVDGNYSAPLFVASAGWGDLVLSGADCPNGPPDESVGVVTDVVALLNKFTNSYCAPKKARADIQPRHVDFKIDISDVVLCLGGFTGSDYPFGSGQCVGGLCSGGPDHGVSCEDDAECDFDFVDIEASGTWVALTASGAEPAQDDGGAVIPLGLPFEFYGEALTSLVVSSNGYVAAGGTLESEDGGDFSNDAMLPAIPDNATGVPLRILPYHEELSGFTTAGVAYHQYFAACPRASEALGTEACTVVQWTDWALRGSGNTFDLQAVLYHESFQIVAQIREPAVGQGADEEQVSDVARRLLPAALLEVGDDLFHALCLVRRHHEHSISRRHHHQVVYSGKRHHRTVADHQIAICSQCHNPATRCVSVGIHREQLGQRRPGPDVGPGEVDRNDPAPLCALHDAVVDRGPDEGWVDRLDGGLEVGSLDRIGHTIKSVSQPRQLAADLVQKLLGAPHEHAGVPQVTAVADVSTSSVDVGLLHESRKLVHRPAVDHSMLIAELQIAVSGLGAGRLDPEGQQATLGTDHLCSREQRAPKTVRLPDDVVRRQHGAYRLGVVVQHNPSGETRTRGGVSTLGFRQDVSRRQLRQQVAGDGCRVLRRHHPGPFRRHQGRNPLEGQA